MSKSCATVVVTPDHGSVQRPVFTVQRFELVKVTFTADVRIRRVARVSWQPLTVSHPPKSAVRR